MNLREYSHLEGFEKRKRNMLLELFVDDLKSVSSLGLVRLSYLLIIGEW